MITSGIMRSERCFGFECFGATEYVPKGSHSWSGEHLGGEFSMLACTDLISWLDNAIKRNSVEATQERFLRSVGLGFFWTEPSAPHSWVKSRRTRRHISIVWLIKLNAMYNDTTAADTID